jgi:hypothetical protein
MILLIDQLDQPLLTCLSSAAEHPAAENATLDAMKSLSSLVAIVFLALLGGGFSLAEGAPAATLPNPAQAEPHIPVRIEGVLVDSAGQPINEGFVMLEGNPQLSALTCSDGRFRIDGLAWEMPDVLLASSAGKEVWKTKVDQSPAKGLTIRLLPEDPDFAKIEMGMALKIGWFGPYSNYRIHPLTEAENKCLKSFDDFLKNEGNRIKAKMLAATELTDPEKRYEFIVASEIWYRTANIDPTDADLAAEKRYYASVQKEFFRVSHKALRRQRLTGDDIHALRLMAAMYRGTGFDAVGANYLQGLKVGLPAVSPGAPLPFDIPFLLTSPLLSSPVWNNYTSLSATTHLRPEGIWPYLDSYWKWRLPRTNSLVMTSPDQWKLHYWQEWYHVTSVNELIKQAHGRPVYLCGCNFTDNTHPGFYERQVEYLRRALRGQADIYDVSQTGGTGWSDIWLDEWTYYGPNPKRDPLAGLDCPRWEDDNYTPLRHARTDKLVTMRLPWISGEILLDQPRLSSFFDNQVALHHNLILDRDGVVATPYCTGDWNQITGRYFSDADSAATYTRQGAQSYVHALLWEQLLRALIENNGRIGPGVYDKVLVQYPQTFTAKDDLFVIKSVDKSSGVIHAGWIDPGGEKERTVFFGGSSPRFGGKPEGDFVFRTNPDTRYVARFKSGSSSWEQPAPENGAPGSEYHVLGVESLKPGNQFYATIRFPEPFPSIKLSTLIPRQGSLTGASEAERKTRPGPFEMGKYSGKELAVERITNYLSLDYYGGDHTNFMPLYGRIVGKTGEVITVKIDQDEVREMSGYRFWKQEEAAGRPASDEPALFWAAIKRWGDGTEADRTYRFKMDGASDIYRNGLLADAKDLAVGDYVFVEYEVWWETQQMQNQIILPERLQASSPLDKPAK